MTNYPADFDPKLDLFFERIVDVPPNLVWKAWTEPKHLMPWFCPKPWTTVECTIDLRPGGLFYTVMRSPEGQDMPANVGCYLETIENKRLSWTNALLPGFRPAAKIEDGCLDLPFTGIIMLAPHERGTKYTAMAKHRDDFGRKTHEDMGFEHGWGKALEQLVEYVKAL